MKILVTGSKGFIGKNLTAELKNRGYDDIDCYDIDSSEGELEKYLKRADFVFHLAGVNRPEDDSEFTEGNRNLVEIITGKLKEAGNSCPVLLSSSIQAELENPYGVSKREGENLLLSYGKGSECNTMVYRLPNVFGKWCRPNYNSAIATFCHNIARDMEIKVNDPDAVLNLVYIDDVVEEFISALEGKENRCGMYCEVPVSYRVKLGDIVNLLYSFKSSRNDISIPDMSDDFTKKLYSTYLSYLPENEFSYPLKMNKDERGSFTEFIRTPERGQVSVNISKPGIVKGNHWHNTKNEKFLVVSGKGVIRFKKVDSEEIIEYFVSGDKLEVVDIPIGYTHNIENLGDTDMVTIMWVNECFDPEKPDTFYLEV